MKDGRRVVMTLGFGLILTGGTASAQVADGVYHLSTYKGGHSSFSDVGGVAKGGREVAIVGEYDEVIFVETTDPFNPVELISIPHSASVWADIDVYGDTCYVVNEGGGGLQIIDVSDLDNIQLVSNRTDWFYTGHNATVDQTAGLLYISGSNDGMPVIDLNSNPQNPSLSGRYTAYYVHDCYARDGYLHTAEIYEGKYRLLDVSTPGVFSEVDNVLTSGLFTHNAWTNTASTLCVTTDESSGGHLDIYDITNKANIQLLGEYSRNGAGIIHNAYLRGDISHISYYEEGYVAVDVSDPTRPVKRGQLDTHVGPVGNYEGVWGVYADQPSGVVYVNDRSTGLHVLVLDTEIEFTPLPNTTDTAGPYSLSAILTPPSPSAGVSTASVYYRVQPASTFQVAAMAPGAGVDEWVGSIPGQLDGSLVEYYVEAVDDIGTARSPRQPNHLQSFSVGPRVQVLFTDCDGGSDEGWSHGGAQDDWGRNNPYIKAGDPGFSASGDKCWNTDSGVGSDGEYESNCDSYISSPSLDLSNVSGTRVRFRSWLNLGTGDTAQVTVAGVPAWSLTGPVSDEDWNTLDVQLIGADGDPSAEIRFELLSDSNDHSGGWNVDDIEIYSLDGSITGLLLTLAQDETLGGVDVERSDIVHLLPVSGTFMMYFDASDVGITGNPILDAIGRLDDGSLLLSFSEDGLSVPGVGAVGDEDLVRFVPINYGANTSGTFEMYFDGSDVGLAAPKEDVVGVSVDELGRLLITTKGPFDVGFLGKNEDIIEFSPTSLGSNTAGSWSLLFDGNSSQVKLGRPGEQLDGIHYRPATGDFVLSTGGQHRVPVGLFGQNDDLLLFTPTLLGSPTEGTFVLLFDGAAFGLGPENINGFVDLD